MNSYAFSSDEILLTVLHEFCVGVVKSHIKKTNFQFSKIHSTYLPVLKLGTQRSQTHSY